MEEEEIRRHLLILSEASRTFDASQKALRLVSKEEEIIEHWRRGRQFETEYNEAVRWLAEHNVSYIYSKEQECYVCNEDEKEEK